MFLKDSGWIREGTRDTVPDVPNVFVWVVVHGCGISSVTV